MYNKNLKYIDNESLKNRLSKITLEQSRIDMSYCMTKSNDYLLLKNDVPIDDIDDPRKAVQEMLNTSIKQPMAKNDIIITFGIGLGYLLDETFNNYPSKIFIYEPDIKLLHFILNNVDISDHLSSGRVFIYDDLDELITKLSDIYITKDKVEIVYLKNYAVVRNQELLQLTQKVYETCKSKMVDINTITRYSKVWVENTLNNVSAINNGTFYKLSDLEDKFIGQTALIVGAGPSLADNIEKIKENRNKFVIFVVNKALKDLLANDITPDFVVGIDAQNIEFTLSGLEEQLSKICYITDLKSDSSIYHKNFKKVFVSFTANDPATKKLLEYNQDLQTYETGGSATTMAFISAVKLGFSKVIFCGLDLAFKGNVVYASGETAERVSQDQVVINYITKNLTTVPSVDDTSVVTTDDYAAFIQHFESLIKDMEYTEVYNTTSFGAKINGMKNKQFDGIVLFATSNTTSFILGEVQPFKLNAAEWTQEELQLINNVIALLSNETFSPALVSAIVKSPLLYQYMQAIILQVLQSKLNEGYAEDFIYQTKDSIKRIIELLQGNKLI